MTAILVPLILGVLVLVLVVVLRYRYVRRISDLEDRIISSRDAILAYFDITAKRMDELNAKNVELDNEKTLKTIELAELQKSFDEVRQTAKFYYEQMVAAQDDVVALRKGDLPPPESRVGKVYYRFFPDTNMYQFAIDVPKRDCAVSGPLEAIVDCIDLVRTAMLAHKKNEKAAARKGAKSNE